MIKDVHPESGSQIRILNLPIPDPRVKKAPDPEHCTIVKNRTGVARTCKL
jgi:hypothetical protein